MVHVNIDDVHLSVKKVRIYQLPADPVADHALDPGDDGSTGNSLVYDQYESVAYPEWD